MPTYQYRCIECGNELEVVQKFTDPALTECDSCRGSLRKVYNAVGVVFKGSGFYRTDSRKAESQAGAGTKSADKSDRGEKAPAASSGSAESSSSKSDGSGSKSDGSGSKSEKTRSAASSTAA